MYPWVARISPSYAWSKGLNVIEWVWWRHQRASFQPCLGTSTLSPPLTTIKTNSVWTMHFVAGISSLDLKMPEILASQIVLYQFTECHERAWRMNISWSWLNFFAMLGIERKPLKISKVTNMVPGGTRSTARTVWVTRGPVLKIALNMISVFT